MLAASILLCLGTMVLIKVGERQKRASTQELYKSHQVLGQAINLLAYLQDAETKLTGYILTGERQYKVEYREAVEEIDERVQAIVELTVMSPVLQGIMVHSLIPKIIEYQAELSEGISIFEDSGKDTAIKYITTGYSFRLMNEIRYDFMDLKLLEGDILDERIQSLEMAYNLYNYIAYAGLVFIGLSIVFGIYLIQDYDQQKNELIRDITRSNDELARLNKQEVALREEKDRFLGMAAHDLRSPLNAIITLADIMKQDSEKFDEEHNEYVDYIMESANQMNTLINNFLDIHRIEDGKKQVKPEKVDIKSLLKALLFKFENRAKQKDISITLDYQLDSDYAITDKSIFSQVVDNLISNAVKFSPKGKNVIVRLNKSDAGFKLEVEDEGYGIKESEKTKLFRKYQTLSARPTGGEKSIGLGLAIVYDQITLIGGEIKCESEEGEGATFIAHFPDMND